MSQSKTHSPEQIEEAMSKIDWDLKINRSEALELCNASKHQELFHKNLLESEKERERKETEVLKSKWTANELYKFMVRQSNGKFTKYDWQMDFIKNICYFISEDSRTDLDLNKGLLIRGVSGIGKTQIIKWMSGNELKPILISSLIDINEQLKESGEYYLGDITKFKILYLDDVGTEEETINHFGTKISFFKNFIEKYYLNNTKFNRLIISTNLNMKQISEKYGFRVASRMEEMFNKIDLNGKDLRK